MLDLTQCGCLEQVQSRLQKQEDLPFSELLPAARVLPVLAALGIVYRERVYSPLTTLWLFLSQALSPDGSCAKAVSRLVAWRTARGLKPCSSDNSSYCQARLRLPLELVRRLTRGVAGELETQVPKEWLWGGRRVVIGDGTTVTLADTRANQAAFPRRRHQKHGVGFPIARLMVFFSLASAAALDLAVGPTQGKKTGENTLFRRLWDVLKKGDVFLGDRLFDSYRDVAGLLQRGVDVVVRMNGTRKCDFRRGRRLGKGDHVVVWTRPKFNSARFTRAEYDALPATLRVRELRFSVPQAGFRTRQITVVTTLLDAELYPLREIAGLFRQRWQCELHLRALKTTLRMKHLLAQSPEMVEKELWIRFLAYNLMRSVLTQTARRCRMLPRRLSFKAAVQTVESFAPYWALLPAQRQELWEALYAALATHTVGDRPDRVEPRKLKDRQATYSYLTKPRNQERERLCA